MNSWDDYWRKTLDNIERTGRSIVGVFPEENSPDPINDAFAYSIGNALKGLPELLLVGMFDDTWIINRLSKIMIDRGSKFDDGEIVSLGGEHPVCIVEAEDTVKERYTLQVTQFLNSDHYHVMQIVLADTKGLFPWQEGCADPFSRVIIHRRKREVH